MIGTDYVGISTLVTALGTIVIGVIVALRQQSIRGTIQNTDNALKMSNGRTIGQVVEANDLTGPPPDVPPPAA